MEEKDKIVVAFDVNGTLTQPVVRELFNLLDKKKVHRVVWSSMGKAYAFEFCRKHNLVADEYADKQAMEVDIAVDDIPDMIRTAKQVLGV